MMVLTDEPDVGRTDAALLAKELTEIYSTPTHKRWPEQKKVICIGLIVCFFTIAGVQYLYPEPMHESYLSTTRYHLWHKRKYS